MQREFGVVLPALLGAAEHVADLVDIAAARGEQPLHQVLRRGVQNTAAAGQPGQLHLRRVDVGCRDRVVHQGRHVHLQHPTRCEETARAREQLRAQAQCRERRARPPGGRAVGGRVRRGR